MNGNHLILIKPKVNTLIELDYLILTFTPVLCFQLITNAYYISSGLIIVLIGFMMFYNYRNRTDFLDYTE